METNWNQLIERYLNNELSAEGRAAFETELDKNPEHRKEFELHKLTHELVQRNSLRTLVKQSGKWFHLKKILINSGIALVIAGTLATAVYVATTWKNDSSKSEAPKLMEQSMLEKLEKHLAFENINPEYFQFTGEPDVFLSESGVLLSITDESFLLNGKPYSGEAIVQWQEAHKASDIVKAGLSTKSGDRLLETQGMFSLNAFTPAGKKLELTKEGIYVQVPVDELKKDMLLFTGVPGKDGQIDWQDPKELERLPKPKDMAKMDLFPPRYEPKLNELKWFKEKAKRDSLYLSFENLSEAQFLSGADYTSLEQPMKESVKETRKSISLKGVERPEDMVHWNFSVEYLNNNYANIVATVNLEDNWMIGILNESITPFTIPTRFRLDKTPEFVFVGETRDQSAIARMIDSETAEKYQIKKFCNEMAIYESNSLVFKQKVKLVKRGKFEISGSFSFQVCSGQSHCLPPYSGKFTVQVSSNSESNPNHIPPSKVLAIWNKKFNKTNLATQDFEDRMKAIHETCDERVFDMYTKNLSTPLWQLDQRVVKMGYPEFQRFADQKVGSVRVDQVHQKNLNAFYEKAIETLRETGKKDLEVALKKEQQRDDELQDERDKEVLRQGVLANLNAEAEANINLTHISKQLGQTLGFAITSETVVSRDQSISRSWYGVPAKRELPIVVNIDRLTKELLSSRNSVDVFTMDKGKKATVRYSDFNANIESFQNFDRLYFYLLPEQLNSYERLDFVNGKLSYPLNQAINYSGLAFGMNESGMYLFEVSTVNSKDLGSIKLQKVSEKQFEFRLKELNNNRGVYQEQISAEIGWLFKEKVNYQVQRKRRENQQFRNEIRPTIYSCLGTDHVQNYELLTPQPATIQNLSQEPRVNVDVPATFQGGMAALRAFLENNIQISEKMHEKSINGRLVLKLIIGEDGKVEQVIPKEEIPGCPECTAEGIRVAKQIPNFIPGEVDSKRVKSTFAIPISFKSN